MEIPAVSKPAAYRLNFKEPDYIPVVKHRTELLKKLRADSGGRAVRSIKVFYKTHPVQFINDWVFTYDPRRKTGSKFLPMILFDRQEEYIEWLRQLWLDNEPGLCEKSRDIGASWMAVAFAVWLFLFHDGEHIGFGSYVERKVDRKGDLGSLLEKARMILRYLPKEFLPTNFSEKEHCPFMRFVNPDNGSTITGETGINIGRGDRASIYFKDESAHYENPELIEASLSATTQCQIDMSSVNGMGNPFFKKRFGGEVSVFVFDWREDPRKDQAWYDNFCKVYAHLPEVVAQEVDRDYAAALTDTAIPAKWIRACLEIEGWMVIDESDYGTAGFDVAADGGAKNVVARRYGAVVPMPDIIITDDVIDGANKAAIICDADPRIKELNYDSIGVGKGTSAAMKRLKCNARVQGVNVGKAASKRKWPDGKRSDERFMNWKAELWWVVRDRAYKTYITLKTLKGEGETTFPADELLVLPNDTELIAELSYVKAFFTETGKIQMESKTQMRTRGINSPDRADALVLSFAEPRNTMIRGTV